MIYEVTKINFFDYNNDVHRIFKRKNVTNTK